MTDPMDTKSYREFHSWDIGAQSNIYTIYTKPGWALAEPRTPGGCAIMIVDSHQKILLVHCYRIALNKTLKEIPRGGAEPGETFFQTAQRETKEETNIDITPEHTHNLGILYPNSGWENSEAHLFLAFLQTPFQNIQHDEEILTHSILTLPEFYKEIYDGTINDSFTLAAALRFKLKLDQGDITMPQTYITIFDDTNTAVTTLKTATPEWSFDQYTRNRITPGWRWDYT